VVTDADYVTGTAAPNTNVQDETPGGMISNAKLTQFSFHNPPSPNLDKLVKFMFFLLKSLTICCRIFTGYLLWRNETRPGLPCMDLCNYSTLKPTIPFLLLLFITEYKLHRTHNLELIKWELLTLLLNKPLKIQLNGKTKKGKNKRFVTCIG